jgi:dTDP-4-dehydrorhamnose 3,5-epimerase
MIFHATKLPGVFVIEMQPHADERGSFARTYCKNEFAERGLCTEWIQTSTSFNRRRGTLRGMHYQSAPHEEIKLVRCTRGAIYDVALDLRPGSPTCREWLAVELTEANHKMLYLPQGIAHGFQTLKNDSDVFYQISAQYVPTASQGVRWDDPAFEIQWPIIDEMLVSKKDTSFADHR